MLYYIDSATHTKETDSFNTHLTQASWGSSHALEMYSAALSDAGIFFQLSKP